MRACRSICILAPTLFSVSLVALTGTGRARERDDSAVLWSAALTQPEPRGCAAWGKEVVWLGSCSE
jgi:hypothetical protein